MALSNRRTTLLVRTHRVVHRPYVEVRHPIGCSKTPGVHGMRPSSGLFVLLSIYNQKHDLNTAGDVQVYRLNL